MRIICIVVFLFICLPQGESQSLSRTYTENDTAYYLNVAVSDYKYFEDDNYYIDLSKINAPCYYKETVGDFTESGFNVRFGQEEKKYNKKAGLYCMEQGKVTDPYGHAEYVELSYDAGFCDRFSSITVKQSKDWTTTFTARYGADIFPESTIHEYLDDITEVIVKGKVRIRLTPVGKRELTSLGYQGVLELFRLEEEMKIQSAVFKSASGKAKSLSGFDLSRTFRQLTKRKFIFFEPSTGVERLIMNIKPFQLTIVESILFRVDDLPKNLLECKGVNAKDIYLYPNPTFDDVFLKFEGYPSGNYSFVVYNIIGKAIAEVPFEMDESDEQVKIILPNLGKGTYLYSIDSDKGRRLVTRRLSIVDY